MGTGGKLQLEEGTAGGTFVGFKAPDTEVTTELLWTLPSTDGTAGQVMSTDGSKVLGWVTPPDVDAETTSRMSADSSLQSSILAETTSRFSADSSLQSSILAETTSRMSADSSLQAAINNQQLSSNSRNYMINGGFDYWQRGDSFSADGYAADRWISASSRGTTSKGTFTTGQTDVSGEPRYFFQKSWISNSTNYSWDQRVEDVRELAGKTVTLSFWAKQTGSETLNVRPHQTFGGGGSSPVYLDEKNYAATSSWQKFTLTWTIPTLAGKTIGTDDSTSFVFFIRSAGATTVSIAQVMLNEGSVAAPFSRAGGSLGGELALCQRYYMSFGEYKTSGYIETPDTTLIWNLYLPVQTRTNPNVSHAAGNNVVVGTSGVLSHISARVAAPVTVQNGNGFVGSTIVAGLGLYRTAWVRVPGLVVDAEL
jgi:hypothetical protein